MTCIFNKFPSINRFILFCILLFPMVTVFAESHDQKERARSSLYLQFNTSGLFSSLSDWKSQLHMSDGTHPSSSCIVFGAEGGWVINQYLQIGVGYEFFFTTKIAANETPGDQVNSTFFYGSLKASTAVESVPEFYLFGSVDVGSIKATEVIENYYYSGRSIDRVGTTNAYRFTAGAQYYLLDNWSIMAGAGYLFGKVKTITVDGQTWPNFSLDLSGFTLRFAVNYHFPL